jgi:hypothetical protein
VKEVVKVRLFMNIDGVTPYLPAKDKPVLLEKMGHVTIVNEI